LRLVSSAVLCQQGMPKAGQSTEKIVDQDVAVNCRRRELELFNQKDSYLSTWQACGPCFDIATLQSILEKACEVLETRAKLQEEGDLACKFAINADPSIDSILACVREVSTPLGTSENLSVYLYKSKELDKGADGGPDGRIFRMIAMVG